MTSLNVRQNKTVHACVCAYVYTYMYVYIFSSIIVWRENILTFSSFQDISEYKCENGKTPTYVPHKPVTGVIGAAFSVVSIMVANILRLFKVIVCTIYFKYMKCLKSSLLCMMISLTN